MAKLTPWQLVGLVWCGVCSLSLGAGPQTAAAGPMQEDDLAGAFAEKLARVIGFASEGHATQYETRVTEAEVNAYLGSNAPLPEGISEPHVTFTGDGRATGHAVVDLDRIRTTRERGWFDPMRYLSGRLPVTATGVLRASAGMARMSIESAEVGGVPVPGPILRELIASYTKSDETPNGVDVDGEHPLPYGIREIQVLPGEIRIIQ